MNTLLSQDVLNASAVPRLWVRRSLRILMFGYFDESGKFRDSNFICVAGLVSDEPRLNIFTEEWGKLLSKYKVPAIHLQQLMALKEPYENFTRESAKAMLTEFIQVIRRNMLLGVGVGMDTKYLRTMSKTFKKNMDDPQYFCFQRILRTIVDHLVKIGYSGPVPLTFDDTEEHAVKCYRLWSRLRRSKPELKRSIPAITFADDEIFLPLQGADLLAHQTRDHQLRMLNGRAHSKHFKDLITPPSEDSTLYYISEYWGAEGLNHLEKQIADGEVGILI